MHLEVEAEETKETLLESKEKIKIMRENFFWQRCWILSAKWASYLEWSEVSLSLWDQPAWKVFPREIITISDCHRSRDDDEILVAINILCA